MASRRGKPGRDGGVGERFAPIVDSVRLSAAWRVLSPVGRALFIELRALANPPFEKNGRVFLSVRDAAERLNVSIATAARAFHELQRLGFIVVTDLGHLGAEGHGKATTYRLTDCGAPGLARGTQEYLRWRPGADFAVVKGKPPVRYADACDREAAASA
jgi:hypothetical protein